MARPTRTQTKKVPKPDQPVEEPRRKRDIPWGGLISGLVVVGVVVGLVFFDPPPPGIAFESQGNFHLSTVEEPHEPYNTSPPSSGPHFGGLAQWGVHEEPIPPELFVHNLEDAGIVFTYDCDDCPELVESMRSYVEGTPGNLLMTPYEGIVDPEGNQRNGAVVAWTRIFYFDEWTEEVQNEVEVFVSIYEGIDHHVGN